jgi:glycine cleavage system H protein
MSIRFTKSHEWVKTEGNIATVGISDYAQSELVDKFFIQLPEAGSSVTVGARYAEIESVKAVSEVYSPVAGKGHRKQRRAYRQSALS